MHRPFINFLAKDLISEIERSISDHTKLQLLHDEMLLRKKAARQLEPHIARIKELLKQKPSLPSASQAPTEPDITPDRAVTMPSDHSFNEEELSCSVPDTIPPKEHTVTLQNPTEVDTKEEQFHFKPGLLARLLGARELYLSVLGDEITYPSSTENAKLAVTSISKITSKEGLFFADVCFLSDGKPYSFSKLSKAQAETVSSWLSVISRKPEIEEAIDHFHNLFNVQGYLNRRLLHAWETGFESISELIRKNSHLHNKLDSKARALFGILKSAPERVDAHNNHFVQLEAEDWRAFFSTLESKPLTAAQVEAILRDEDATLVVAGAGTGKTSTVVGKVGYLLSKRLCKPEEVLALAFGRDAAAEMKDRIKEKTRFDVQIRTFHSLGLYILQEQAGIRLKISDVASNDKALMALLARIFKDMLDNDHSRSLVQNFISFHRYPAKYLEDFDAEGDYFKYMRKYEPVTLRGEPVKSFEELLIADWLTLHGIRYAYENPYEQATGSRQRNQYRPDFYLVDYQIYLEHFGIDRQGRTAPSIDQKKYNEGIKWKRDIHKRNGTKLIETYSWERKEGIIFDLLQEKLESHGIKVQPAGKEIIQELLDVRDINRKLVSLTKDFLSVFKEGQWTIDEVRDKLAALSPTERVRANSFVALFEDVFNRYEQHLSNRQEIDFADLIMASTRVLNEGKIKLNFKRIIVDEYQDISRGRYRFLQALLKQSPDCRIMCVGDDWQSIYGFTGSDVTMTTCFESLFGFAARVDLNQTFRFTEPILDSSARFIQRNPRQLKKQISARQTTLPTSIEILAKTPSEPEMSLYQILETVNAARPARKKWKVLLLGRYNFLKPNDFDEVCRSFSSLSVDFMSIHKSKGLEADAVVVLGLTDERYGFPGTIETDPLMGLIIPGEDDYEHAEERRVLYVAMTRAKEYLLLCTDSTFPSCFVEELANSSQYPEIHSINLNSANLEVYACPKCTGRLCLKYPNRKQGYAWVCNLSPYCDHKAKTCSKCQQFPLSPSSHCSNPTCKQK